MKGSWIADNIIRDMRKEKYYKNKKREKCIVDNQKKCTICRYQKICEDAEYERNNSVEPDK